jgi:hypothetical protein
MAERAARVAWHRVLATKQRQSFGVVVAAETGICTVTAVVRAFLRLRRPRRQRKQ